MVTLYINFKGFVEISFTYKKPCHLSHYLASLIKYIKTYFQAIANMIRCQ